MRVKNFILINSLFLVFLFVGSVNGENKIKGLSSYIELKNGDVFCGGEYGSWHEGSTGEVACGGLFDGYYISKTGKVCIGGLYTGVLDEINSPNKKVTSELQKEDPKKNKTAQNVTTIDNSSPTCSSTIFTIESDSQGRLISYPNDWNTSVGSDGRKVAYPSYGWTTSTGSDGRKVAYPSYGWTTSTGSDGRKVAYPSYGWTTSTGSDGRKVAYPSYGWTTSTGSDGRKVAYPNGWGVKEGKDGRLVTFPCNDVNFQSFFDFLKPYLEEFKNSNESETRELVHYFLYLFVNDDE